MTAYRHIDSTQTPPSMIQSGRDPGRRHPAGRHRRAARRPAGRARRPVRGGDAGQRRRGADHASEAADRQAAARPLRPDLGAQPAVARPVGAAARGVGGGHRRSGGQAPGGQRRRGPLPPGQAGAWPVAGASAARAGGDPRSDRVSLLPWQASQARRGGHRDVGGDPSAVEGDPDGAGEIHLPHLREHHPTAGAVPPDRARPRRAGAAGDDPGGQVRSAFAAEPAE